MSDIADHISSGCLLLGNESFAATSEREGSEIAREIIRAMVDRGVTVCFVTHLFDLAHGFYEQSLQSTQFLRAERQGGGQRTFRLAEGEPLPTSYGEDVYARVFATDSGAAAATAGTMPPDSTQAHRIPQDAS